MTKKTKADLTTEIDATIFPNVTGDINAADHNTLLDNVNDSVMNELEPAVGADLDMAGNSFLNSPDKSQISTNTGNISTNTTDIGTNTTDIADRVVGPASSTTKALAVYDGITGKLIENSSFLSVQNGDGLQIGTGFGGFSGAILLNDADASNQIILASAANVPTDYAITLPAAAPAANQVLESDGSGDLTWIDTPVLPIVEELRAQRLTYSPTNSEKFDWTTVLKNSFSTLATVTINDGTNRFTLTALKRIRIIANINVKTSQQASAATSQVALRVDTTDVMKSDSEVQGSNVRASSTMGVSVIMEIGEVFIVRQSGFDDYPTNQDSDKIAVTAQEVA